MEWKGRATTPDIHTRLGWSGVYLRAYGTGFPAVPGEIDVENSLESRGIRFWILTGETSPNEPNGHDNCINTGARPESWKRINYGTENGGERSESNYERIANDYRTIGRR